MASSFRRTYTYLDQNGRQESIRINAKNEREADLKFQSMLTAKPETNVPTLRQFVSEYYQMAYMHNLKSTTQANYQHYLNRYILPFFGDMPLDSISVIQVQEFMNRLAAGSKHGFRQDIKSKTIDRIIGLMGRIFKIAQAMKLIDDTPVQKVLLRNNGAESGHHTALPRDELDRIKRLIPTIQDARQRLYAGLIVYTGMRKEEVLGLRWEDVDWKECCAEVIRAVTYPGNNVPVIEDSPKTKSSKRTVVLPSPLVQIMKPLALKQGFVIHGRTPDLPASYSTQKRTCQQVFEYFGIKGLFSSHDMRSTFITDLKENGVGTALIADMVGHADSRMIETVYTSPRKEGILMNRALLDKLNEQYVTGT